MPVFEWRLRMHYYGTRLSENISRREPEGYLLCLNVPVARTGTQEYLPEELGLPPATASGGNLAGGFLNKQEVSSPVGTRGHVCYGSGMKSVAA